MSGSLTAIDRAQLVARFEAKISAEPNSGCWLWTGHVAARGYGYFLFGPGESRRAHRIAWKLANGDPGNLLVCHRCDNKLCVNPAHLFLGTDLDNVRDMDTKGRRRTVSTYGGKYGCAQLTKSQVVEIRNLLAARHTHWAIATKFGVAQSTIDAISTGRRWGWFQTAPLPRLVCP